MGAKLVDNYCVDEPWWLTRKEKADALQQSSEIILQTLHYLCYSCQLKKMFMLVERMVKLSGVYCQWDFHYQWIGCNELNLDIWVQNPDVRSRHMV